MEPKRIRITDPELHLATQGIKSGDEYDTIRQNRTVAEKRSVCYVNVPSGDKKVRVIAILPHEYETIEFFKK